MQRSPLNHGADRGGRNAKKNGENGAGGGGGDERLCNSLSLLSYALDPNQVAGKLSPKVL